MLWGFGADVAISKVAEWANIYREVCLWEAFIYEWGFTVVRAGPSGSSRLKFMGPTSVRQCSLLSQRPKHKSKPMTF